MTSSNGNIFRVTGHLCGKFTGQRWISHTKASDAELWRFLWSAPERLSKQSWGWWFETLSSPLWRHRNKSFHKILLSLVVQDSCFRSPIVLKMDRNLGYKKLEKMGNACEYAFPFWYILFHQSSPSSFHFLSASVNKGYRKMRSFMFVWFIFHYIPTIYTSHWHGVLFIVLLLQLRCHFRICKCWIYNIQSRKMYQWYEYSKLIITVSKLGPRGSFLCVRPANERRRYNITSSLICWTHT